MAGLGRIKNVRGGLLSDQNSHCWVLSPETQSKSCHHTPDPSRTFFFSWQDEHSDSPSLVSVFLSANWDGEAPPEAVRIQEGVLGGGRPTPTELCGNEICI